MLMSIILKLSNIYLKTDIKFECYILMNVYHEK